LSLKENPATDEIRAGVERILASRTFGPRASIHTLLVYLLERSLDASTPPPKEYTIGVEAFGRPESYDPQQDPYVRVQAGRLRNKLEEYYRTEGAEDPLLVELPKRQFRLQFSHKETIVGAPEAPRDRKRYLPWLLVAVLAIAVVVLLVRDARRSPPAQPAAMTPELAAVWGGFLNSPRPILLCLGTHQFYKYTKGYIREPGLDEADPSVVRARLEELRKALASDSLAPRYGYTGTGQATSAFLLGKFLGEHLRAVQLVRSSALTWDEISENNVIFLSAKVNPQIQVLPQVWPFRVDDKDAIVNRYPKPGELKEYVRGPTPDRAVAEEYSLLTFSPGLHGRGELLIVESPTTTGFWSAIKYLTERLYAADLVAKVTGSTTSMPRHFQLVIRSRVRDAVPIHIEYVTHRPL
jgi:hypothetical protein